MQEFAAHFEKIDDGEEILAYVYAFASERGATALSYHCFPRFETPNSERTFVHGIGFPEGVLETFVEEGLMKIDPVPALVFANPPILSWHKAVAMTADDPVAVNYFKRMREFGQLNGVSFSLYGPQSRDGYAAMVFEKPPGEMPEGLITLLHGVMQAAHVKICQITVHGEEAVDLSERELEVLHWMSLGKSAANIATILSISPDTVKTYVKRLYEKLGVGDKVAATVKGLRLGLIHF